MKSIRSLALLVVLPLVAAACSSGAVPQSPPTGDEAWRTARLVDTRTGDTFTVQDLRGRLVAIEPMAVWCTNCRIQQLEAQTALATLTDPDVVYVSIGVDPNERAEDLAAYAERWGFDWRFVIASPDVARSLAASFGDQVLSPPSTPLVLLGRDGMVVDQHFGIRSADELLRLFAEHRS
jgi:cytochrome oxidase Cu insertion factor (SCO1/SenC/PrrC family)